jgi:hypothetical protein
MIAALLGEGIMRNSVLHGRAILPALAALLLSTSAYATTFGAIGYSAPTDSLTMQSQCDSEQECEDGVMKSCREQSSQPDQCQVLVWFRDACGAFAKASNGAYGSGWGTDENIATQYALKVCRDNGGQDCSSNVYVCSTGRARIGGGN